MPDNQKNTESGKRRSRGQAGGTTTDLEDLRRDLRRVRSILSQRQRRKARWITITALTALLYSAFAIA